MRNRSDMKSRWSIIDNCILPRYYSLAVQHWRKTRIASRTKLQMRWCVSGTKFSLKFFKMYRIMIPLLTSPRRLGASNQWRRCLVRNLWIGPSSQSALILWRWCLSKVPSRWLLSWKPPVTFIAVLQAARWSTQYTHEHRISPNRSGSGGLICSAGNPGKRMP